MKKFIIFVRKKDHFYKKIYWNISTKNLFYKNEYISKTYLIIDIE